MGKTAAGQARFTSSQYCLQGIIGPPTMSSHLGKKIPQKKNLDKTEQLESIIGWAMIAKAETVCSRLSTNMENVVLNPSAAQYS